MGVGFCFSGLIGVCVSCAHMWVICICLSGVFLYRADAPTPLFRGGAVRFSFFWGLF